MKKTLLIEIECHEKTCGECDYLSYEQHRCYLFYEWLDYTGRHHYRCNDCYDSERSE